MKTQTLATPLCRFATLTVFVAAQTASADEIGLSYSGPSGGNWSAPGNWTPSVVPNNGADVYNVTVPSPLAVNVDGTFSIRSLDLNAGAGATLPPGSSLTLSAGATVDGILNMGATGNFNAARIQLAADMAFGGSGTVEMRGVPVIESATGARLTVGSDLTLHCLETSGGFGGFPGGLGLTNQGEIDFEGTGNNNFNHTESDLRNSGVFRVRNSANVFIHSIGNPFLFDNSGTVVVDGGLLDIEGAAVKNTDTIEVRNNGIFEISQDFDNTGGILLLESGGKLSTVNFFGLSFTGGSISGAGGIIEPQGTLTLQGGPANDTLEISGTSVVATPGNVVQLSGAIDLADGAAFSGNGIRISGHTEITGTGSFPLQLAGGTGNDSLTLGGGIKLTTGAGAGAGSLSVKTIQTAGPVEVDSGAFTIGGGNSLTSTGNTHLFPNAVLTANGSFSSAGGTVQLDSGALLGGGILLDGSTVSGAGTIRPNSLGLAGNSMIGTPIETGTTTVTVTGAAQVAGSGILLVNQGFSGTTTLNAAAPGNTLTTGTDFDLSVTANHTLTANLPWNFQGHADINGGVMVIASDFDNDGVIDLSENAQLQVNKSILSTSTGSINAATGTTVTVNGASELGGTLSGEGIFNFTGTVPVIASGYTGSGTLTLGSGANVSFSQSVGNIPVITVNSNNAKLNFNGGLEGIGTASVTGSGGVLDVTGDTTVTGLFQVRNGATLGGAGTTTAEGDVEFNGTLNGRTLIAENPTTARQITMANNAIFLNRDIFSFFTFGPPATVTGVGVLRNEGTITQADDPFGGPIPTNIISTDFEQTSTGVLAPKTEIALTGDSNIAGTATIPEGAKLTLGAGAGDTTHSVTGAITGNGTLKISGNTLTGAAPATTISGAVNLSGSNSGTEIRDGATLQLTGQPSVQLGHYVSIEAGSDLFLVGIIGELFVSLFDLVDRAGISATAPVPGEPPQRVTAEDLTINADDAPGVTVENIHLRVTETCDMRGNTDLSNSVLETAPACSVTLRDGAEITSGNPEVSLFLFDGSDVTMEGSGGPANPTTLATLSVPTELLGGGSLVVQSGAEFVFLQGFVVNSHTAPFDLSVFGYSPGIISSATGEAPGPQGLRIEAATMLRGATLNAHDSAQASITFDPAASRDDVEDLVINADEPHHILLGNIFHPNATVNITGTGSATVHNLLPQHATATFQPGSSAGRLHLTGNIEPASSSGVILELGGTIQTTQYDLLSVDGVLTATNTSLRPLFIDNFQNSITPTDTFTVIETTEPIVGTFSNVSGGRVMAADGSGSFSVTMADGNTRVILGDFIANDFTDSDSDGMPDDFEEEHFGHPTDGDPDEDEDKDGQSNLDEYTAGTNPTDSTSVLRITEVSRQGNDVVISFESAPNKAYRIEAGTTLADGFPLFIQNVPATPEGGTRQVTHTGGGSLPARFYRAVTPPPP